MATDWAGAGAKMSTKVNYYLRIAAKGPTSHDDSLAVTPFFTEAARQYLCWLTAYTPTLRKPHYQEPATL
jgi:hypothetical protein